MLETVDRLMYQVKNSGKNADSTSISLISLISLRCLKLVVTHPVTTVVPWLVTFVQVKGLFRSLLVFRFY